MGGKHQPDIFRNRSPAKSTSSPAAMCRIVVLPQPEGPIIAPKPPASSRRFSPRTISTDAPSAETKVLASMRSSSGAAPPSVCSSFKRLHQQGFDRKHKCHERDRIAQNLGHIEQGK